MSKLIYGKQGQVRFNSEAEKMEAFRYLLTSPNVEFVHEDNQEQGAWAPEERIHFRSGYGVPECLIRNMTAGNGSLYGRINCKELCDELRAMMR
jgi:hypothetical protein